MKSPVYTAHKHSGIVTDLPPEEVAPINWTGGSNVQFQETATVRVGGYEAFADIILGTAPLFTLSVIVGPNAYWIYCSTTHVYVTDGQNHWNITPAAGLTPCELGDWTATILNGIPVLNNTLDAPFYWDLHTGNKCLALPGWPAGATCKVIRSFKYHLFALNIFDGSEQPNTLWWSESAVPGAIPQEWTPTPENDAGDMTLADTPSGIVDGLPLRDNLIIYKDYATYALSYVAGQYVYTQRKLFLTSGLQSANCVTEINGEHWAFTGTDLIRHDGQNYVSVVQNKVKRDLVDSIEPSKLKAVCVTARHRNQQIWVGIPTAGKSFLNKAFVINIVSGDIGTRELPNVAFLARGVVNPGNHNISWESDNQPWDEDITFWDQQNYSPTEDSILMAGGSQIKLWSVDSDDLANGQPMHAYVERLSLPTNDNILRTLVTRVAPRLKGTPGDVINISVGGQDFFDQPIAWSPPQPFTIGSSVAINCQVEGRLISVRFEGTTSGKWTVFSYKLAIVDLGLY